MTNIVRGYIKFLEEERGFRKWSLKESNLLLIGLGLKRGREYLRNEEWEEILTDLIKVKGGLK